MQSAAAAAGCYMVMEWPRAHSIDFNVCCAMAKNIALHENFPEEVSRILGSHFVQKDMRRCGVVAAKYDM